MWFVALIMLLFYGLAVCTIGGMVTSGVNFSVAMANAVPQVMLGVLIARVMYRDMTRV